MRFKSNLIYVFNVFLCIKNSKNKHIIGDVLYKVHYE